MQPDLFFHDKDEEKLDKERGFVKVLTKSVQSGWINTTGLLHTF